MVRDLINGNLDRLERFGKIVFNFAGPLILAVFCGAYFGWIPSPLLTSAKHIEETLILVRQDQQWEAEHIARQSQIVAESLTRVADILRMIDCGAIPDPILRNRCLNR